MASGERAGGHARVACASVHAPVSSSWQNQRQRDIFGAKPGKKPWAEAMAGIQFWVTSFGLDVRASTAYSST